MKNDYNITKTMKKGKNVYTIAFPCENCDVGVYGVQIQQLKDFVGIKCNCCKKLFL